MEIEMHPSEEDLALEPVQTQQRKADIRNHGRIILCGASNVRDLESEMLLAMGPTIEVCNAAAGGVAATELGVKTLGSKLAELKLTQGDLIVLEFLSNSVIREKGNFIPPTSKPKRHHFSKGGFLTENQLNQCLASVRKLMAYIPSNVSIVLLPPFPRYLNGGCCTDTRHFKNHDEVGNAYLGKGTEISRRVFQILKKKYSSIFPLKYSDICNDDIGKVSARTFFMNLLSTDCIHYREQAHELWCEAIRRAIVCLDAGVEYANEMSERRKKRQDTDQPSRTSRFESSTSNDASYSGRSTRNDSGFNGSRYSYHSNRSNYHRNNGNYQQNYQTNYQKHRNHSNCNNEALMIKVNEMFQFIKNNQANSYDLIRDQQRFIQKQEEKIRALENNANRPLNSTPTESNQDKKYVFNGTMNFGGPVNFS